ncbi:collagen alpha-1(XVI) chain [Osmerus mordax]|uniref:collagen alpha-1(XVI) chain n=1 Tax=Osmerus mordax TaxID=8014 RepID=UPI00350ED428
MRAPGYFLVLVCLGLGSCDTPTSSPSLPSQDVPCPPLQVEDWKFPQTARHNITGFNLVRRFSLLKSADIKKIRNPRGPVILRLGKTALVRPTDQVFPHGLPEEFTVVLHTGSEEESFEGQHLPVPDI